MRAAATEIVRQGWNVKAVDLGCDVPRIEVFAGCRCTIVRLSTQPPSTSLCTSQFLLQRSQEPPRRIVTLEKASETRIETTVRKF